MNNMDIAPILGIEPSSATHIESCVVENRNV